MRSFRTGFIAKTAFAAALAASLGGCGGDAAGKDGKPRFRFAPISRADVVSMVEATGTVTPRNTSKGIPVGAQVNGRIVKLFVDYNSAVTNGQVVALIDPLIYDAAYKREVALLHVNEANVKVRAAAVKSCEAELVLAEKTYARKKNLAEKSMAPIADLDSAEEALAKAKASLESANASLVSAKASVEQSRAAVENAKANLDYCTIRSPVNGIVIDRKVEEGETVVSSYNAVPVLTIAEDLKVVWVEATVPEADVGNIKAGQDVTFTADAYRRRFKGKVKQVRKAATTTNNVVTYPIIIEAENPGEMLFPGMTATLSIETARADNALAVSAAAFRFRPKDEDREAGEVPRGRKIWIVGESGKLKPLLVEEGVSDATFTQLLGVDGLEGAQAAVGYETAASAAGGTTNPFKPKFPQRNKNRGTAPEPKGGGAPAPKM
ncbi:MAG: efflux RND transporter periplasmic adaptor subunit [Kiritimatiellae bacterium]|nr:efflux RND transporter periplasmic adaptor subunit [Kiritimatiellia bacterium]